MDWMMKAAAENHSTRTPTSDATVGEDLAAHRRIGRCLFLFCDKKQPADSRRTRNGLFHRFLKSRAGVTLVEFALVGPLFLLLTFAIVDNGLVLFMQTVLDNATREAARQIEIGKVQLSGDTDGTGLFKTTLCNNLGGLIPCASLQWRVQSDSTAFSNINSAVVVNGSGNMTSTGFNAGTAQSYVLVQVAYRQPYMVPLFARLSSATGNLLLVSTVAVQNEHYQ
jgi:Flp pilus assembly protein TadG